MIRTHSLRTEGSVELSVLQPFFSIPWTLPFFSNCIPRPMPTQSPALSERQLIIGRCRVVFTRLMNDPLLDLLPPEPPRPTVWRSLFRLLTAVLFGFPFATVVARFWIQDSAPILVIATIFTLLLCWLAFRQPPPSESKGSVLRHKGCIWIACLAGASNLFTSAFLILGYSGPAFLWASLAGGVLLASSVLISMRTTAG